MDFNEFYFNEDIISEMLIKGNRKEDEDQYIMAFDKWIYFLEEDSKWKKTKQEIMSFLDIESELTYDVDELDIDDFMYRIAETVSDVLIGKIEDNVLYIESSLGSNKFDPKSSIIVKKVVNQLGLEKVRYPEDLEDTETELYSHEIKGEIPDYAYHGTTSEYFEEIIRLGLRPGRSKSNWSKQGISHPDKIFFTTRIGEAQGHSTMTASKVGGYPMIIKFKIPDKNLLIADYDVEVQTRIPQFYEYHTKTPYEKSIRKKSFSLSKEFGIYGYKGSIMPKYFESFFIAFDESSENVFGLDQYQELNVDEAKDALYPDYDEYDDE